MSSSFPSAHTTPSPPPRASAAASASFKQHPSHPPHDAQETGSTTSSSAGSSRSGSTPHKYAGTAVAALVAEPLFYTAPTAGVAAVRRSSIVAGAGSMSSSSSRRPSKAASGSSRSSSQRAAAARRPLSERIGDAAERLTTRMARAFRLHGVSISHHPVRTLLLACLIITSLFYPAAGIYLWSSQGGPGLSRSDTSSVWRTLSTPLLDSFASSGRTHLNSLRDLRMVWDDAPDLTAQDPRDWLPPATPTHEGKDVVEAPPPPPLRCVRLEHVLFTTDDVMRGAGKRAGVLDLPVLNSALRLQAALEVKLQAEALNGVAQCIQTANGQCLTLSPLDYWPASNEARSINETDADAKALLLAPSHNVSSRGIPLGLETTLAGRAHMFARNPSAQFLALSFWLEQRACGEHGDEHERWVALLRNVTGGGVRIVESEIKKPKELVLRFTPDSVTPRLHKFLLGAFYALCVASILRGLVRMQKVHSRWGMAFTGCTELLISMIVSISICALCGFRLSAVPWEILPFVIVVVGSENMFVVTNAVVSTPINLTVPARVGAGLGQAGVPIAITVISDVVLMSFIIALVDVAAVREFCIFAICSLIVDFFLQMTMFVTVLSIDLQRLELADLLTQGHRASHNDAAAASTDSTAASQAQNDAQAGRKQDTQQQQQDRRRKGLQKEGAQASSFLKLSFQAVWRARTARTASLSVLLAAMFGLYLYYGTGYDSSPMLPFAEPHPSSTGYSPVVQAAAAATTLPAPTSAPLDDAAAFDPYAHLPEAEAASQVAHRPWWMDSPSASFWQALNPSGAHHVRISVEPWTIVSLKGATRAGREHTRAIPFASWALFRPRVRALIWFFKLTVLPIGGTTGLLWMLLLYLLKDTELLHAQLDKEDAETEDEDEEHPASSSERSRDVRAKRAKSLKLDLHMARAVHTADVELVAVSNDVVVSVALDSSLSIWRTTSRGSAGEAPRRIALRQVAPNDAAPVTAVDVLDVWGKTGVLVIGQRSGAVTLVQLQTSQRIGSTSCASTSPVQYVSVAVRNPTSATPTLFVLSVHRDGSAWSHSMHGEAAVMCVAPRAETSWTAYAVAQPQGASSQSACSTLAFASASGALELRERRDDGSLIVRLAIQGPPLSTYRSVALSSVHFGGAVAVDRRTHGAAATVLCGTSSGLVQVWDLATAQLVASVDLSDGPIGSLHVASLTEADSPWPVDVVVAVTAAGASVLRLGASTPHAEATYWSTSSPFGSLKVPGSPTAPRPQVLGMMPSVRANGSAPPTSTPTKGGRSSRPGSANGGEGAYPMSSHGASTRFRRPSSHQHERNGSDAPALLLATPGAEGEDTATAAATVTEPLKLIRRISTLRGGAALMLGQDGRPVLLGVRRRRALGAENGDARRWEAWLLDLHSALSTSSGTLETLRNAGGGGGDETDLQHAVMDFEAPFRTSALQALSSDEEEEETQQSLSRRGSLRFAPASPDQPSALSFTRLRPVLALSRSAGSSSETTGVKTEQHAEEQATIVVGFGNSLARISLDLSRRSDASAISSRGEMEGVRRRRGHAS